MPHQTAPKIELSPRVRKIVQEIVRQRRSEHRQVIRARLMLAMADGAGNNELARKLKMDRGVVRCWRNRWLALAPKLIQTEASAVSVPELRELLLSGLSDLPAIPGQNGRKPMKLLDALQNKRRNSKI